VRLFGAAPKGRLWELTLDASDDREKWWIRGPSEVGERFVALLAEHGEGIDGRIEPVEDTDCAPAPRRSRLLLPAGVVFVFVLAIAGANLPLVVVLIFLLVLALLGALLTRR
jgi:hypothetical protein